MDKIHENSHITATGELETKYVVAGREVCKVAFCESYGFALGRLLRIRRDASLGQVNVQHGNLGQKRCTSRVEEAKVWMKQYFDLIGDKMPDKVKIHLSSWESQCNVYGRYKMKAGMLEEELVSLSTIEYGMMTSASSSFPRCENVCNYKLTYVLYNIAPNFCG